MLIKSMQFTVPDNLLSEMLSLGLNKMNWIALTLALIILFVVDLMQERMEVDEWFEKRNWVLRYACYGASITLILVLGMYGQGISSSSFVYMQF